MATINYEFYDENLSSSHPENIDEVLYYMKKYSNNYDKALEETSSWPVIYHLSDTRKNVVRWYPFENTGSILEIGADLGGITEVLCDSLKNVTSVEFSKEKARAIYERNIDKDNLEIIVGNLKNIKLTEKYDYILLNEVLEYSSLYMDTINSYEDLLNILKKNLKSDGKILIAIENKTGLKYWCGANENHTNRMFEGLNNYSNSNNVRTFSKYELENLAKSVNMHVNFYYMFPDHKFPKIVLTDKFLERNIFVDYCPYYCEKMNIILDEHSLYKEIFDNKAIPFFANSYFIELSNNKEEIEVEFAKFNSEYRKQEYNLCTYLKNNKYYKKALSSQAYEHIKTILKINDICEKNNIDFIKVHKDQNEIYTESIEGISLLSIIKELYTNEKYNEIEKIYDDIYIIIKRSAGKKVGKENNIFEKYGIHNYPNNFEFYEHGIIDIIPDNIIIKKDKKYLIDQEWYESGVPLEYMMFRAITSALNLIDTNCKLKKDLLKKYNIDEKVFSNLEEKNMENIKSTFYPTYIALCRNFVYHNDINYLVKQTNQVPILNKSLIDANQEKQHIENQKNELTTEYNRLQNEYNKVINSRGWKMILKIRKILNKFRRK